MVNIRVGNGIDVHALVFGRRLVLGGVTIPFERGLQGHSDADALLHAICDAVLGALGAGDIGAHFPDSDPRYKEADSRALLRTAPRSSIDPICRAIGLTLPPVYQELPAIKTAQDPA